MRHRYPPQTGKQRKSGRQLSLRRQCRIQASLVARGPWFGDTGHVFRLGLGYEPLDRLEQGLGIISAALAA